MRRGWYAAVLAMLCAPAPALGQGTLFGSFGVDVSQGYESNVFAQPEPLPQSSDSVTRLGPVVEAGYRSGRFRTVARYETAADERYWQYPELNRRMAKQESHAEIALAPSRHVSFGAIGDFVDTYTPLELGIMDTLVLGRVHAQRLTAHPSLVYAWSTAGSLTLEYDFARELIASFAPSIIHTPRAVFSHEISRTSLIRLSYRERRWQSVDGPQEMSRTAEIGMTRRIGRLSQLEFDAGPRRFEGRLYPEVSAALRHPLRRGGELMVGYTETDASVLGEGGILEMREVRGGIQLQIAKPLRIVISPTLFRAKRGELSSRVAAMELTAVTQLASRASLVFTAQAGRQEGDLGGAFNRIPYFRASTMLRVTLAGSRDREPARTPTEPATPAPLATPATPAAPAGNQGDQ